MPMRKFDLAIIGGGVAGLVSASGAARFGARVALVESVSLGGDCLRSGCVPTKRLVRSAKVASLVRRAGEFGIDAGEVRVDFPRVMELMRKAQAKVGEHDSPERFSKMGVELFFGKGRFTSHHAFLVNGEEITAGRFIIATGSSPVVVPIKGLGEAGALTNETALTLTKLPGSLAILGGGPIGIEFSQVFARLGSKVTVFERRDRILPREDKELSDLLMEALASEGVRVELETEITSVERIGGKKVTNSSSSAGEKAFAFDEVMAAMGRSPNVEGLGLETAGVEYDRRKGIKVDGRLRTSQAHIFGAGDVASLFAFTHVAEYQAGIALGNALFPLVKRSADYSVVPWTTFTDPELARVGFTEGEAREKFGNEVRVYRFPFEGVDRAVTDGETAGLIKLVCRKKHIVGAHILGAGAGELIHEYVLAMRTGVPVTAVSGTIHVYPTLSMGVKRAADQYYVEKLFSGLFPRIAAKIIRRGR